jgi:anion-transporting  ArsA/GET3 family ATPase
MMLDPKRTFDDLIDRVAPSRERAEEIKRNRVYLELSSAVSGSQEFTAIEKLYELASGDYDLLVLDTPPAHNAVEFLNAPGRLTAFLGGGALQALLRPSGIGMRLIGLGAAPVLAALKMVTGVSLVTDLTAFFALLGSMTDEFKRRAERVEQLLHAPDTAFLLVTSAEDRPVREAMWFRETLRDSGMPLAGAIVNRVNQPLPLGEAAGPGEWEQVLPPDLAAAVAACVADHTVLAERDAANIERLRDAFASEPMLEIPEFIEDIHDIAGLLAVHRVLFDE